MTADRTTADRRRRWTPRHTRRLLDGLAVTVSVLDLLMTARALHARRRARRPLYRDARLPTLTYTRTRTRTRTRDRDR